MIPALVAHALLALICLVGFVIESRRAKARRLSGPAPLELHVQGQGPWVRLGASLESSLAEASAEPVIDADAIELGSQSGARLEVPAGARLQLRKVNGARRLPLEGITKDGVVQPRMSFDVPPGTVLYAAPRPEPAANAAYRDSRVRLVDDKGELTLAGQRDALPALDTSFPGCWLMILFPCAGGGWVSVLLGSAIISWVLLGGGLVLCVLGFAAMSGETDQSV